MCYCMYNISHHSVGKNQVITDLKHNNMFYNQLITLCYNILNCRLR
jgi:hypothetical protein